MDHTQALRQTRGQRQHRPHRQGSVGTHRFRERRAGHIRRGQPRHRAVQVPVHHHDRERAAHPPRRGDLTAQPHPELRIRGQLSSDDFYRDRDLPPARGLAQEHLPHTAAAKPPHQPVRTD
jgi:hypothetical protein